MSKGGKPTGSVFDVGRIKEIVELMEQHDLVEVDLQEGDDKIKLNRGFSAPAAQPIAAPVAAAPVAAAPAASSSDTDGTVTINSPIVGTFYSKPNPNSENFVKVGSSINTDTVVCIVEAMKVFNEIPAECSGTIVEILIDDQQPVDVGKPLFRVKLNA